jgi:hypothetical protein
MEKSDPGKEARRSRRFRSAERAFWWGVLRTERDRRLALAAGRPVTSANLRRLLMRRIPQGDKSK